MAIPDGVDLTKITTGVVVDPDGTVRHVPAKDVQNHWAKEAVNDMGSRLVISGVGNDNFEPDRDITRAEFAAIIVRALGLKPGKFGPMDKITREHAMVMLERAMTTLPERRLR